MWRVGGLAPISGVPNGRGGLIGSGTNAPLYTTSFSAGPKTDIEDRHEGRLAEALEIDRASRVLEFREPSALKSATISKGNELQKTLWSGTQWILGGPNKSIFYPLPFANE